MGFDFGIPSIVSSMFGLKGGNQGGAGLRYNAQNTNILQPTNIGQTDTAAAESQQGINSQQAFLNALAAQGGIQNQANVFSQQQALANQLQGVANGTGPNPAQAALNQATGANTANQAALMAGQRGSGANIGLLARQAAMQGGANQQQAIGQSATLQAQQQLAGMNALQNQQGMMGNLAGTQVAQQQGALQGYNQAAQSEQQNLLNSLAQSNTANVAMQGNINNANAGIAGIAAQGQAGLIGGGAKALTMFGASGGEVPRPQYFDMGGSVQPQQSGPIASQAAKNLKGGSPTDMLYGSAPSNNSASMDANGNINNQNNNVANTMFKTGENLGGIGVKGLKNLFGSSSGAGGADMAGAGDLLEGGTLAASKGAVVPGKAPIAGDSLKNDKVPAMLSPKEIVLPRSITLAPDAPDRARAFVAAILAKKGMGARV